MGRELTAAGSEELNLRRRAGGRRRGESHGERAPRRLSWNGAFCHFRKSKQHWTEKTEDVLGRWRLVHVHLWTLVQGRRELKLH